MINISEDTMKTKKRVLIVDDEPDILLTVEHGLIDLDENYHIVGVPCGEDCIKFLQRNQMPDVILLDIMMPEMSGWETFDKIKENSSWKQIPIVFLTGRTDRIALNAGRFLGDDYIEKPFEIADLKKRIDALLVKKLESK